LVVLGASQKLLVMHVPQLCCLDGIVGIKGIRDPMMVVVVSTSCYLHFISSTLTTFSVVSLHWWRLGSWVLPWVNGVCMGVGIISCIVGDVARSVGDGVGRSISCSIGSRIGWLHHLLFTSSLFSYCLKGTIVTMLLTRTFRSTPGVGNRGRSTISMAYFFDLSSVDMDISLETSVDG
jgi:hypothetical protein